MKLLHISSSLKIGGAEAVLVDLIKHMNHVLFEHHVIYFHDGPHQNILKKLGIKLYRVKGAVSLYDPFFVFRLGKTIKKINPDCIHTVLWSANIFGRILGRMLGIPVVSAMHNNVDQYSYVQALLDCLTLPLANKLIAVSPEVAHSIGKRFFLVRPPITIIQNGIDIEQLHTKSKQADKTRSMLGLDDTHFIIGSVGRFMPVKRYDLMIESFAILYNQNKNARLVLVGVGSQEFTLKKQVISLNLENVVIFVIGQPAYGYYHLFDCFSMSSDKEGTSIALLEAMAFSKPCVVTNSHITHSVLSNGINGLLVQAGNADQLAQAFAKIYQHPLFAHELGLAGYQVVSQKFYSHKMVKNYEKIFIEIA